MKPLKALLCGAVWMLAACDSRVDPPPAPVHRPTSGAQPSAAPTTLAQTAPAAPPTPVVENASANTPDPGLPLHLAEDLKSPDGKVRRDAAARLSALGADAISAMPALMDHLRGNDVGAKNAATEVVVAIGSPAVPYLVDLLLDLVPYNRMVAIDTLKAMGPKAEDAAPALIAGLGSGDSTIIHHRIITALVSIGKPAVPALIAVLTREGAGLQDRIFQKQLRGDIMLVLQKLGPAAKDALPVLKAAAEKDPSGWAERTYAMINAGSRPVSEISAELGHRDPKVRDQAAEELRLLGPAAKDALPALIEALKRQDIPKGANRAILAVGPEAVLPLLALLESQQEEIVLRQAAGLLKDLELPPEAVTRLTAMLRPSDGIRTECALEILEKLGPKGTGAIPAAIALLRAPRDSTRQKALQFLEQTQSSAAATALAPFLKDPDSTTRILVLQCLRRIGPAALPVKEAVRELLKDPNSSIRSTAEQTLKGLEGKK